MGLTRCESVPRGPTVEMENRLVRCISLSLCLIVFEGSLERLPSLLATPSSSSSLLGALTRCMHQEREKPSLAALWLLLAPPLGTALAPSSQLAAPPKCGDGYRCLP